MATHWTLGCDAADPQRLAAFWAGALGYRAKVVELVAAGATEIRAEQYGEFLGHVVMNDPEGNEFCVA
jgi:hypothetical protein